MMFNEMTREKANHILRMWKTGAEYFPLRIINLALYVCGDLQSYTLDDGCKVWRV